VQLCDAGLEDSNCFWSYVIIGGGNSSERLGQCLLVCSDGSDVSAFTEIALKCTILLTKPASRLLCIIAGKHLFSVYSLFSTLAHK